MTDKKYKWASPAEWLIDQINNEWGPDKVQQCAVQLATMIDSDTLQDMFQEEMDCDGYFEPEE